MRERVLSVIFLLLFSQAVMAQVTQRSMTVIHSVMTFADKSGIDLVVEHISDTERRILRHTFGVVDGKIHVVNTDTIAAGMKHSSVVFEGDITPADSMLIDSLLQSMSQSRRLAIVDHALAVELAEVMVDSILEERTPSVIERLFPW